MEWKVSYLSDKNIIRLEVTGAYDAINGLPAIKAVQAQAKLYGCLNWLLDMRATVRYLDTFHLYRRPDVYDGLGISSDVRKALVFDEVGKPERFYETVCRNRGFDIFVFSDIDTAIDWLTGRP